MRAPRGRITVAVTLAVLLAASLSAAPPERKPLALESYLDWESTGDPRISPDGSRVVYTRRWVNQMNDGWDSSLWLVDVGSGRNRFLANGSGARWSPDGTRIAYVADGEPEGPQIFVRWMDSEGATTQVTRVTQSPGNLAWSPNGRSIAFSMLVPKEASWKIDMPAAPKKSKWTDPPRLIETTHYRQDRRGFMMDGYTHIFVVDAEAGTPRQLTSGDWDVGARPYGLDFGVGLDWTPDGEEIVFDGLQEAVTVDTYARSHLYAVKVSTGDVRRITSTDGLWSRPVVSPDGRMIAFTGFDWTPQTYRAEELYVIGRDGTGKRKISGDLDRDPTDLNWAPDGSGVYFTTEDRGSSNVHFAPLRGAVRALTRGTHVLSLTSIARNGSAVGVVSSPHQPNDVALYRLPRADRIDRLTRVNEDLLERTALGEVEEIWYDSTGGARVQGWIVKPPDFDSARKYPLILHIHGGPHAMYDVGFSFSFQHLAASGYLVLYTNPRGSTGYGTDFGNAIDDDYPGVDYDDLMAGVDAVVARGYVDRSRMYVTGVSGGGVLSSWIISHTDRFAAAAVRAPVIDWISFAGTTDVIGWGYLRFRSRFWEDPEPWLAHSPLMHVAKVKTPTLLMTGELDLRTPMAQTEEYYQALKAVGVETALLRFNGEYHGTGSIPSNFMRTQLYLLGWFGKHSREPLGSRP